MNRLLNEFLTAAGGLEYNAVRASSEEIWATPTECGSATVLAVSGTFIQTR
ncbi:MAG: hypothetical protein HWE20_03360 [Gammaproteobacteria bacterium]|nr:hypothetical protein [Gammaproteobacteria bacterium]